MADLASDHDSAIRLIINEYRRLKKHNENHDLLKYLSKVTDDSLEWVNERYPAFLDRFETPEDKKLNYIKVAKVYASYYVALRKAVDKIEGIDSFPKPFTPLTIESKVEKLENLPF